MEEEIIDAQNFEMKELNVMSQIAQVQDDGKSRFIFKGWRVTKRQKVSLVLAIIFCLTACIVGFFVHRQSVHSHTYRWYEVKEVAVRYYDIEIRKTGSGLYIRFVGNEFHIKWENVGSRDSYYVYPRDKILVEIWWP